ncbi:MAG TPA: class A beta-lactamase [Sphingomonas sp.]
MDRRSFLWAGAGALATAGMTAGPLAASGTSAFPNEARLRDAIVASERSSGGRLGVAVLDTGSSARFAYRGDERFPLCSTFKLVLVAAILSRIDRGQERSVRRIRVTPGDILGNSPFARRRVGRDASVVELSRAAIVFSDNSAANLLLPSIGGPAGLTRFIRSLGDPVTRLDRGEPALGAGVPGDPRDTTSPTAMVGLVRHILLGGLLTPSSRQQLETWLMAARPGIHRLRAGLPVDWRVGDKTGTGDHGSNNDVAILWPPRRAPLVVASYLTQSPRPGAVLDATHAAVARAIVAALGG